MEYLVALAEYLRLSIDKLKKEIGKISLFWNSCTSFHLPLSPRSIAHT